MPQEIDRKRKASSPYSAVMTREQFLFHETRITAKLLDEGLEKDEIIKKIFSENLFQYPTEKSVRRMVLACLRRLEALSDQTLITAIAAESSDVAKQICLYAMMRQYRLVWAKNIVSWMLPSARWICMVFSCDCRSRMTGWLHGAIRRLQNSGRCSRKSWWKTGIWTASKRRD